jgi:hypothetical protein
MSQHLRDWTLADRWRVGVRARRHPVLMVPVVTAAGTRWPNLLTRKMEGDWARGSIRRSVSGAG